jgi:4-aminobutyrate aminotransferase-like enzyme
VGGLRQLVGEIRGRGETQGIELVQSEIKKLYSKELRSLVMGCMMREPTLRPTSVELQNRVKGGLSTALEEEAGD